MPEPSIPDILAKCASFVNREGIANGSSDIPGEPHRSRLHHESVSVWDGVTTIEREAVLKKG